MPPTPTARATAARTTLAAVRLPLPARRASAPARVAESVVEERRHVGRQLVVQQEPDADDEAGQPEDDADRHQEPAPACAARRVRGSAPSHAPSSGQITSLAAGVRGGAPSVQRATVRCYGATRPASWRRWPPAPRRCWSRQRRSSRPCRSRTTRHRPRPASGRRHRSRRTWRWPRSPRRPPSL